MIEAYKKKKMSKKQPPTKCTSTRRKGIEEGWRKRE